jgi:heat shock protein HslJ
MTTVNEGDNMRHALLSGSAAILMAGMLAACAETRALTDSGGTPPAWPDSRWRAVAIAGPDGAMVAIPAAVRIDLAFDGSARRASGSAGCNRWTASASSDGGRLAFGPAAASKRMCADPEGVMAVEAAFLGALGNVAQASIDGERLRLSAADGSPVLELVRDAGD